MISCDLVIPVTVAVQRREHDAERTGPLTEEDEEVMPKALLWKQEAPVVHWRGDGDGESPLWSQHKYSSILKSQLAAKSAFSDMIIGGVFVP